MALRRGKKKQAPGQAQRKLVTKTNPKSPISEQYRTIRTNITFSTVDETIRSLMITSASPAEGKSTTTANLAITFAQQGMRVLLVDSDMRKPTMQYTFNVPNNIGLTNVLAKQKTIKEAVSRTDVSGLEMLSSGPIPPNPAELLGSRAMKEFFKEAYMLYDMVIFDTPPVLAVTDAQVLANQCDGAVLVVNSGKTEVDAAAKAKELLEAANARLLGVVLNNRSLKESNYYYYYGNK
ncbi:CpsD/CapB family tyrosine-protein kinase [Bacillus thermotolerans]|uniref:non-specific protein-tyrosine kinase n=1 Tax=Bacillus thermotolerans TaxID=1221996 RepID=A0A0F5I5I3_BACTR|nr:CpsD/CapB family tyrosine-protein kinase [Bacillus thermotolerans]KKB40919.1 Tyrosine-protein kinase EpsD [Bacillus thermotolerans]